MLDLWWVLVLKFYSIQKDCHSECGALKGVSALVWNAQTDKLEELYNAFLDISMYSISINLHSECIETKWKPSTLNEGRPWYHWMPHPSMGCFNILPLWPLWGSNVWRCRRRRCRTEVRAARNCQSWWLECKEIKFGSPSVGLCVSNRSESPSSFVTRNALTGLDQMPLCSAFVWWNLVERLRYPNASRLKT